MTPAPKYRIPIPLPLPLLLLLVAAYLLPGLIDHDPWKSFPLAKPDDAVSFGIVFEATRGNWLVPTLAGEPYAEVSPLYFWIAALLGKLFSGVLPLHAGARLASGLFTGIAVYCTALAAGELYGAAVAVNAALILLGCVGLLLPAHGMIAGIALLAAVSAVLLGVTMAGRRPLLAGAIAGTGTGAAFLAQGIAPAIAALLLAVFVLLQPATRRAAPRFGATLVAAALPWFVLWPVVLHSSNPQFLNAWWDASNLAQLPGFSDAPAIAQLIGFCKLLGWFAWPALPMALWTVWLFRFRAAQLTLPLAAFFLLLGMLVFASDMRDVTALPLLAPLSVLGAASAGELRRGAANALDWFGMMTFSLLALVVWVGYVAIQTGAPEKAAQWFFNAEPGFAAHFDLIGCSIAVLFTVGWVALIVGSGRGRSPSRGVTHWAAGVTLAWGVFTALLMPWVDYGKSYRGMSAELQTHLIAGGCVASRGLGEPQRASLEYFAGLITLREEVAHWNCKQMLVQGSVADDSGNPGAGWTLVWQGNRPGDRSERYRLYQRQS